MRYIYRYKTSANEKREGEISSSSREAVYRTLKLQGIRPFQVELAPGILNRIQSLGKRTLAIVLLAGVAVGATILYFNTAKTLKSEQQFQTSTMRRQPIGDAAVIDMGIRTGWADVFVDEGDRFLASFAIPGVKAAQRQTSVEQLESALRRTCQPLPDDTIEARQIKAMVEGVKDELRKYLQAGGTIALFGQRLVERQETEIHYYEMAKQVLDAAANGDCSQSQLVARWEQLNNDLRRMGIRLLPYPTRGETRR